MIEALANYQQKYFKGYNTLFTDQFNHVFKQQGGHFRFKVAALIADLFEVDQKSLIANYALVDMVHRASLLHDDVVDGASIRRGKASFNAVFGNKHSILFGDLILSKAMHACVAAKNLKLLELTSKTLVDLCQGELIQASCNINRLNDHYYNKIAQLKTASLIKAASLSPISHLKDIDATHVYAIERFALNLGIAFQKLDDLKNIFPKEITGKDQYIDLNETSSSYVLVVLKSILGEKRLNFLIEHKKFDVLKTYIFSKSFKIQFFSSVEKNMQLAMKFIHGIKQLNKSQTVMLKDPVEKAEQLFDQIMLNQDQLKFAG